MLVYGLMGVIGLLLMIAMILLVRIRTQKADIVAYGLRGGESSDENTKTNLTEMETGFDEAMAKLEELGEVKKGQWGGWVWTKNGKEVGKKK